MNRCRKNYNFPLFEKEKLQELSHQDLETAKKKLSEAKKNYEEFFKANPDATTKNAVFGELTKFEWELMNRKHLNHHFKQFNLL